MSNIVSVRYFEGGKLVIRNMNLAVVPRIGDHICTRGWNGRRVVEQIILHNLHERDSEATVVCSKEEVQTG